ncbi:hypothetical protein RH858_00210 [Halalkaliarchaeum sp. AArc-GB]|uniref:hypothetical protein n=1 Tax=Halalkaliarchaeum sp. AArc-GB TaxID=3074078 RepID=UPI00285AD801|nr:hypothetical protein [Halalkaliarchaeum sp. AArc-GB]MDR5671578.1 hypothetical protein [Halalkaliarchaeum sp. AArc-GB]
MAKVSVGLRGWRFEEAEIFDEDGEFKPLDEIPDDASERLVRLLALVEEPCDACYLVHGEADISNCRPAEIVYGEPGAEVLLCGVHEPDFLYWFREAGGSDLKGTEELQDAFHEWFADGNRAPDDYGGLEHVETAPEELPEPPSPQEIQDRLDAQREEHRIDIKELASDASAEE